MSSIWKDSLGWNWERVHPLLSPELIGNVRSTHKDVTWAFIRYCLVWQQIVGRNQPEV